MKNPLSKDKVRSRLNKALAEMVDVEEMKGYICAQCGKPMGPEGIRGVSVRLNAQFMGDIVMEIQCPHCSSGYDLHYRKACDSILDFAHRLMLWKAWVSQKGPDGEILHKPVPSYEIQPHDNNLLFLMQKEISENQAGKGK